MPIVLILFLILSVFIPNTYAATCTSQSNGSLFDAGTFDCSTISDSDDFIIQHSVTWGTASKTMSGEIRIQSSGTLTIDSAGTISGELVLAGGTLDVNQNLTLNNTTSGLDSSAAVISGSNVIDIASGKTLTILDSNFTIQPSSDLTLQGDGVLDLKTGNRNLLLLGSMTWNGSAKLGSLALGVSTDLKDALQDTLNSLELSSTVTLNYDSTVTTKTLLLDSNTLTVQANNSTAEFIVEEAWTMDNSSDHLNVQSSIIRFKSRLDIKSGKVSTTNGSIYLEEDGELDGGTLELDGNVHISSGKTYTFSSGSLVLKSPTLKSGTLDVSGKTVRVTGGFHWEAGELTHTASTTFNLESSSGLYYEHATTPRSFLAAIDIQGNATLSVASGKTLNLTNNSIDVDAYTLTLAGSGTFNNTNPLLLNHASSILSITSDGGTLDKLTVSTDQSAGKIVVNNNFTVNTFTLDGSTTVQADLGSSESFAVNGSNGVTLKDGNFLKLTGSGKWNEKITMQGASSLTLDSSTDPVGAIDAAGSVSTLEIEENTTLSALEFSGSALDITVASGKTLTVSNSTSGDTLYGLQPKITSAGAGQALTLRGAGTVSGTVNLLDAAASLTLKETLTLSQVDVPVAQSTGFIKVYNTPTLTTLNVNQNANFQFESSSTFTVTNTTTVASAVTAMSLSGTGTWQGTLILREDTQLSVPSGTVTVNTLQMAEDVDAGKLNITGTLTLQTFNHLYNVQAVVNSGGTLNVSAWNVQTSSKKLTLSGLVTMTTLALNDRTFTCDGSSGTIKVNNAITFDNSAEILETGTCGLTLVKRPITTDGGGGYTEPSSGGSLTSTGGTLDFQFDNTQTEWEYVLPSNTSNGNVILAQDGSEYTLTSGTFSGESGTASSGSTYVSHSTTLGGSTNLRTVKVSNIKYILRKTTIFTPQRMTWDLKDSHLIFKSSFYAYNPNFYLNTYADHPTTFEATVGLSFRFDDDFHANHLILNNKDVSLVHHNKPYSLSDSTVVTNTNSDLAFFVHGNATFDEFSEILRSNVSLRFLGNFTMSNGYLIRTMTQRFDLGGGSSSSIKFSGGNYVLEGSEVYLGGSVLFSGGTNYVLSSSEVSGATTVLMGETTYYLYSQTDSDLDYTTLTASATTAAQSFMPLSVGTLSPSSHSLTLQGSTTTTVASAISLSHSDAKLIVDNSTLTFPNLSMSAGEFRVQNSGNAIISGGSSNEGVSASGGLLKLSSGTLTLNKAGLTFDMNNPSVFDLEGTLLVKGNTTLQLETAAQLDQIDADAVIDLDVSDNITLTLSGSSSPFPVKLGNAKLTTQFASGSRIQDTVVQMNNASSMLQLEGKGTLDHIEFTSNHGDTGKVNVTNDYTVQSLTMTANGAVEVASGKKLTLVNLYPKTATSTFTNLGTIQSITTTNMDAAATLFLKGTGTYTLPIQLSHASATLNLGGGGAGTLSQLSTITDVAADKLNILDDFTITNFILSTSAVLDIAKDKTLTVNSDVTILDGKTLTLSDEGSFDVNGNLEASGLFVPGAVNLLFSDTSLKLKKSHDMTLANAITLKSLVVSSDVELSFSKAVSVSDRIQLNGNQLTLTGSTQISTNDIALSNPNNHLRLQDNATLTITSNIDMEAGTLEIGTDTEATSGSETASLVLMDGLRFDGGTVTCEDSPRGKALIKLQGTLDINSDFSCGGSLELLGSTTVDFTDAEFDTTGADIKTLGHDLTFKGSDSTLNLGDVSSTGGTVFFEGSVTASKGSLSLTNSTLKLSSPLVLSGTATSSLSSSIIETTTATTLTLISSGASNTVSSMSLGGNLTYTNSKSTTISTLGLNNHSLTLGSGDSDIVISNALTLDHANEQLIAGTADVTLSQTLTMSAGGIQSTTGALTFSNDVTVTGGQISSDSGNLTFSEDVLLSDGQITVSGGNVVFAKDIQLDGGTLNLSNAAIQIGAGSLILNGGTFTQTGGTSLSIDSGSRIDVNQATTLLASIALAGTLDINANLTLSGNLSFTGNASIDVANDTTFTYSGSHPNLQTHQVTLNLNNASSLWNNTSAVTLNDATSHLILKGLGKIQRVRFTGADLTTGKLEIQSSESLSIETLEMTHNAFLQIPHGVTLKLWNTLQVPASKKLTLQGNLTADEKRLGTLTMDNPNVADDTPSLHLFGANGQLHVLSSEGTLNRLTLESATTTGTFVLHVPTGQSLTLSETVSVPDQVTFQFEGTGTLNSTIALDGAGSRLNLQGGLLSKVTVNQDLVNPTDEQAGLVIGGEVQISTLEQKANTLIHHSSGSLLVQSHSLLASKTLQSDFAWTINQLNLNDHRLTLLGTDTDLTVKQALDWNAANEGIASAGSDLTFESAVLLSNGASLTSTGGTLRFSKALSVTASTFDFSGSQIFLDVSTSFVGNSNILSTNSSQSTLAADQTLTLNVDNASNVALQGSWTFLDKSILHVHKNASLNGTLSLSGNNQVILDNEAAFQYTGPSISIADTQLSLLGDGQFASVSHPIILTHANSLLTIDDSDSSSHVDELTLAADLQAQQGKVEVSKNLQLNGNLQIPNSAVEVEFEDLATLSQGTAHSIQVTDTHLTLSGNGHVDSDLLKLNGDAAELSLPVTGNVKVLELGASKSTLHLKNDASVRISSFRAQQAVVFDFESESASEKFQIETLRLLADATLTTNEHLLTQTLNLNGFTAQIHTEENNHSIQLKVQNAWTSDVENVLVMEDDVTLALLAGGTMTDGTLDLKEGHLLLGGDFQTTNAEVITQSSVSESPKTQLTLSQDVTWTRDQVTHLSKVQFAGNLVSLGSETSDWVIHSVLNLNHPEEGIQMGVADLELKDRSQITSNGGKIIANGGTLILNKETFLWGGLIDLSNSDLRVQGAFRVNAGELKTNATTRMSLLPGGIFHNSLKDLSLHGRIEILGGHFVVSRSIHTDGSIILTQPSSFEIESEQVWRHLGEDISLQHPLTILGGGEFLDAKIILTHERAKLTLNSNTFLSSVLTTGEPGERIIEVNSDSQIGTLDLNHSLNLIIADQKSMTLTEGLTLKENLELLVNQEGSSEGVLKISEGQTLDVRGNNLVFGSDMDLVGVQFLSDAQTHLTLSNDIEWNNDTLTTLGSLSLAGNSLSLKSKTSDLQIVAPLSLTQSSEEIITGNADLILSSLNLEDGSITSNSGSITLSAESELSGGLLALNNTDLYLEGSLYASDETLSGNGKSLLVVPQGKTLTLHNDLISNIELQGGTLVVAKAIRHSGKLSVTQDSHLSLQADYTYIGSSVHLSHALSVHGNGHAWEHSEAVILQDAGSLILKTPTQLQHLQFGNTATLDSSALVVEASSTLQEVSLLAPANIQIASNQTLTLLRELDLRSSDVLSLNLPLNDEMTGEFAATVVLDYAEASFFLGHAQVTHIEVQEALNDGKIQVHGQLETQSFKTLRNTKVELLNQAEWVIEEETLVEDQRSLEVSGVGSLQGSIVLSEAELHLTGEAEAGVTIQQIQVMATELPSLVKTNHHSRVQSFFVPKSTSSSQRRYLLDLDIAPETSFFVDERFHLQSQSQLTLKNEGSLVVLGGFQQEGELLLNQGTLDLKAQRWDLGTDMDASSGSILSDQNTELHLTQNATLTLGQTLILKSLDLHDFELELTGENSGLDVHSELQLDAATEQLRTTQSQVRLLGGVQASAGLVSVQAGRLFLGAPSAWHDATLNVTGSEWVLAANLNIAEGLLISDETTHLSIAPPEGVSEVQMQFANLIRLGSLDLNDSQLILEGNSELQIQDKLIMDSANEQLLTQSTSLVLQSALVMEDGVLSSQGGDIQWQDGADISGGMLQMDAGELSIGGIVTLDTGVMEVNSSVDLNVVADTFFDAQSALHFNNLSLGAFELTLGHSNSDLRLSESLVISNEDAALLTGTANLHLEGLLIMTKGILESTGGQILLASGGRLSGGNMNLSDSTLRLPTTSSFKVEGDSSLWMFESTLSSDQDGVIAELQVEGTPSLSSLLGTVQDVHVIGGSFQANGTTDLGNTQNIVFQTQGILVSDVSEPLQEQGRSQTVEISLSSQPQSDVFLDWISSDFSEVKVEPRRLVFNATNWQVPQSIQLVPQDDNIADGDQSVFIEVSIAADEVFQSSIRWEPIYVDVLDDDRAGINAKLQTSALVEEGKRAIVAVSLFSAPTQTVHAKLRSNNPSAGEVLGSGVTFTPSNWSVPQLIEIQMVDDTNLDGEQGFRVEFEIETTDPIYGDVPSSGFQLVAQDNEQGSSSNQAPTANAGRSQEVNESTRVLLDGSGSFDGDGVLQSYAWIQIAGTFVDLKGGNTAQPYFDAPEIDVDEEPLVFQLVVTDNQGDSSSHDVTILVLNTIVEELGQSKLVTSAKGTVQENADGSKSVRTQQSTATIQQDGRILAQVASEGSSTSVQAPNGSNSNLNNDGSLYVELPVIGATEMTIQVSTRGNVSQSATQGDRSSRVQAPAGAEVSVRDDGVVVSRFNDMEFQLSPSGALTYEAQSSGAASKTKIQLPIGASVEAKESGEARIQLQQQSSSGGSTVSEIHSNADGALTLQIRSKRDENSAGNIQVFPKLPAGAQIQFIEEGGRSSVILRGGVEVSQTNARVIEVSNQKVTPDYPTEGWFLGTDLQTLEPVYFETSNAATQLEYRKPLDSDEMTVRVFEGSGAWRIGKDLVFDAPRNAERTVRTRAAQLTMDAGLRLVSLPSYVDIGRDDLASTFNGIKVLWRWKSSRWQAFSPNEAFQQVLDSQNVDGLSTALSAGEGFWVEAENNVTIGTHNTGTYDIKPLLSTLRPGWHLMGVSEAMAVEDIVNAASEVPESVTHQSLSTPASWNMAGISQEAHASNAVNEAQSTEASPNGLLALLLLWSAWIWKFGRNSRLRYAFGVAACLILVMACAKEDKDKKRKTHFVNRVHSVWAFKGGQWKAYAPSDEVAQALWDKGIGEFTDVQPGEGFWIRIEDPVNTENPSTDLPPQKPVLQ